MVSERQLEANRRNARKSTGPSSHAGKKRAGQNAYRHGLTGKISNTAAMQEIEKLARKIAGPTADTVTREFARTAAEAQFELGRVRELRVAIIHHVSEFGRLEPDLHLNSKSEARGKLVLASYAPKLLQEMVDPLSTMLPEEPDPSMEAMRRALPDLLKLDRYERRAATRRDRSLYEVFRRSKSL